MAIDVCLKRMYVCMLLRRSGRLFAQITDLKNFLVIFLNLFLGSRLREHCSPLKLIWTVRLMVLVALSFFVAIDAITDVAFRLFPLESC